MIEPKNNPTWTWDKEYWWNPYTKSYYSSHYSHFNESNYNIFKPEAVFKSEMKPKFIREINSIGFNK